MNIKNNRIEQTDGEKMIGRLSGKKEKPPIVITTAFYIPNTEEGRKLIADMKAHLNKQTYRLRVRGRGPRKSVGASKDFITKEKAEWFGVYVTMKEKPANINLKARQLPALEQPFGGVRLI